LDGTVLEWFANLPSATVPAWLGFVLSAVLAAIKVWELVRDRVRVDGDFASLDSVGNQIHIRNLSPKAIILIYWDVFYATKPLLFRKKQPIESAEDSKGVTIAAMSTYTLSFQEQNYFSTDAATLDGRAVFIRLYFAGRRP
jgi:hypothetical protein